MRADASPAATAGIPSAADCRQLICILLGRKVFQKKRVQRKALDAEGTDVLALCSAQAAGRIARDLSDQGSPFDPCGGSNERCCHISLPSSS